MKKFDDLTEETKKPVKKVAENIWKTRFLTFLAGFIFGLILLVILLGWFLNKHNEITWAFNNRAAVEILKEADKIATEQDKKRLDNLKSNHENVLRDVAVMIYGVKSE